jgi:hypothetical protein
MKKYLIHFMSVDMPSVEDDGVTNGTNFGVYNKTFNTREEAEKGLEELIAEDQAGLEDCYGITEMPELADDYNFEIANGSYDRKELNVYDAHDGYLLNSTIYEIVEVEF